MSRLLFDRTRVVLLTVIGWLLLQWTVSFTFHPHEFNLDLSRTANRSSLQESWKIIPSLNFKSVMDVSVSEAPGSVVFSLKETDTQYVRIKARLMDPEQELRVLINQKPWKNLRISRKSGVQKWSGIIRPKFLSRGENRLTLQSSTPAPVFIEKISVRNYRSDPDISHLFIGLDKSSHGKEWLSVQWCSLIWLPPLALFFINTELGTGYFWNRIYRARKQSSVQKIIWAGFTVPIVILFILIVISSFTQYMVLLTLPTYWMIWIISLLFVHLFCALIGLIRRALDQIVLFIGASFIAAQRTVTSGVRFWTGATFFLSRWLWTTTLSGIKKIRIDAPKAYRIYWIGLITGAVCLILQSTVYLFLVADAGKIVDAHGSYPLMRKTAELIADLSALFLPVLAILSFRSRNRL